MNTFHGHPCESWIGRSVKSFGKSSKGKVQLRAKHGHAAKIVRFGRGTVTIIPIGHGQEETVPVEFIGPWWSKNPDLKPTRAAIDMDKLAERRAQRLEAREERRKKTATKNRPKSKPLPQNHQPPPPKPSPKLRVALSQWGSVREGQLVDALRRIVQGPVTDIKPSMDHARAVLSEWDKTHRSPEP